MLDIQHISKTFNVGTVNEKRAVTDLSLHLDKGDFVTVIGSNGAGKSTLFNAIAGSFYVDEGRILLNGKDITFTREHDRSRVIGRLFQDPLRGTAPHMSIEENLALAYLRAAHGNPFSRITAKDRELFRAQLAQLDMGLEDRLGQPVGLLSGGQRQALTLLMATMVPPELLLLLLQPFKFLDQIDLEFRADPHSEFKRDVLIGVCAAISPGARLQTDGIGFFDPFLHAELIAV